MRAYYYDNIPGDQRLPHDSGKPVSLQTLNSFGVVYQSIPVEGHEGAIDKLAKEQNYTSRVAFEVSKQSLGDSYEAKIKEFFEEHLHEDEEFGYVLSGSGYYDFRGSYHTTNEFYCDAWIRIQLVPGDLIILPAGIYHRFTVDEKNAIKPLKLLKDNPKITPLNRGDSTDHNPFRVAYLNTVKSVA